MILYHGSDHIIEKPIFHGGNRHNDYGFGFYCTANPDMAREWSSSAEKCGYLNSYEIDANELRTLNLDRYPILCWLAVLLENRSFYLDSELAVEACRYLTKEFHVDYEDFDIRTGYRADDSYFSFARDFINGTIPLSKLSKAMKLGELGTQIVLKSEKAIESLRFVASEEVDSSIWFPKRIQRDEKARKEYHSFDKGYVRGDIYITRILDEEIKSDDTRLQ